MSMKIYNESSSQWEKQSSLIASSIKVLDAEGKFKPGNNNVEFCLDEMKDDVTELKHDVKYIYENGTIGGGGGGGGGGSVLPVVTVMYPDIKPLYVTSTETVEFKYSFTSPNRGGGQASIVALGKVYKIPVSQNEIYTYKLGPFPRNASGYVISVSVVDSQGFGSVPAEAKIISGAIDISSTFDPKLEFSLSDDIMFPLNVESDSSDSLTLECNMRGTPHKVLDGYTVKKGMNMLPVGRLPAMGPSKISFKVKADKYESNELRFNLIASDSISLHISSEFEPEFIWKYGNPLKIDYRLSKRGEYQYISRYFLNDMDAPLFDGIKSDPSPKYNYWNLGTTLPIGEHVLKIESRTLDSINVVNLIFKVTVTAAGFNPHPVTPGAIAYFNASGKQNTGSNRTTWKSEIGDMTCGLHGFNYETNGFGDGELKFEGKSYGIIDYSPFNNGLDDAGFTFEITYKSRNTGDNDARVMHCLNENSKQGMYIDTEFAAFETKSGALAKSGYEEDKYITKTFVIDPTYKVTLQNPLWENDKTQAQWFPPSPNGVIKLFTNGTITSVDYFNTLQGSDFKELFKYSGKILLGARCRDGSMGQDFESVDNFGSCEIKSIRIYNKFLTDTQVVDNYISMQNEEGQRDLLKINDMRGNDIPYAGIPKVRILDDLSNIGEGIPVNTFLWYEDPLDSKNNLEGCAVEVTWQGTSSKDYPVRNYTIKMFAGGGGDKIPLVTYSPNPTWLPEYRWTLKANYMDSSQANNVGAAKHIHTFTTGRFGNLYPQQQLNPKTRNCVDGIPIRLSINDVNFGVYTFNIDRYAHQNYGLSTYKQIIGANNSITGATISNSPTAVSYEISGNGTTSSGFRTNNFEDIKYGFKHRFNYREKEGGALVTTNTIDDKGIIVNHLSNSADHSELMSLMHWMNETSNIDFWQNASQYWSIPHLIDYYLTCQMLGMVDSLGKNMVITCLGTSKDDEGNIRSIWYPSFYDCDTILGINNTGQIDVSSGIEMSEFVEQNSKLWNLLTTPDVNNPFPQMISRRYSQLRTNIFNNGIVSEFAPFSFETLIQSFENHVISKIGQKFYNEDAESKYIKKRIYLHMCSGSRLSFTRRWLKERLLFLDSHYESPDYTSNRIALRSNVVVVNGKIRIKTYSPQKIKIQFQDGAAFSKLRCNRDGWTEFNVDISNVENNNTTIYGANNIMEVEGIKDLNISFLDIQNANKLSKLDVSGNVRLTSLIMNNNVYLRTLNLKDCRGMGTDEKVQRINVSGCTNLRKLDVNNTSIKGIDFNSVGGYIDFLDISRTPIKEINIVGQGYLTEILSTSNDLMTGFSLRKCNAMKAIDIVNSKLERFIIEDCANVTSVNISGTSYLDSIRAILCPSLTSLNLSRVNGPGARQIDLTTILELLTLDISNSSINHIKFGQYSSGGVLKNYDKLTTLNAAGSALISIGFGVNAAFNPNDHLDLGSLPKLTNVNFTQCSSLKYVDNMTIVNGSTSFNQCRNLISLTGNLDLTGSMNSMFYECVNLTTLPTFNLSKVSSMKHTFYGCRKITMNQARTVLQSASTTMRDLYGAFRSCNLSGPIPSDIFSKCTNVYSIELLFAGNSLITGGIGTILSPMGTTLVNTGDAFFSTGLTECPTASSFASLYVWNVAYRMFTDTKITTAPESGLFARQKLTNSLQNIHSMFRGCASMTGEIPETLFQGMSSLNNVSYFFSGTSISGTIPAKIFDINNGSNNGLLAASYFVNGCSRITGQIPEALFSLSPSIRLIEYFFSGTSVEGKIPPKLLAVNNAIENTSFMFNGCSKLGTELPSGESCTIPVELFKNKIKLQQSQYMFNGCSEITGGIKQGTFDDCIALYDISGMFQKCSGFTDQLPLRESTWEKRPDPTQPDLFPDIYIDVETVTKYGIFDNLKGLKSANNLFAGCTNMISTIPPTLLRGASVSFTNANNIFDACYRITGEVPKELFASCKELVSVSGAFRYCRSLNNPNVHDPNAADRIRYIVHPDLFKNNSKLENVDSLFDMWQEFPPGQVPLLLSGTFPPGLFKNNTQLKTANSLFISVPGLIGYVDSSSFNNCINLESVANAFFETNIIGIDRNLFTESIRSINFYRTFYLCDSVTTQTFDYDKLKRTSSNRTQCFGGSSFTNLASVPNEWK